MKSICVFIFSIVLFCHCSAQTENELIINYEAATRGSNISFFVNSSVISYISTTENKKNAISKKQWNEIKEMVSKIDLDAISSLEPPSHESTTDRALIASLTITKNDKKYQSSYFDHGNPPKELIELIDKLFILIE